MVGVGGIATQDSPMRADIQNKPRNLGVTGILKHASPSRGSEYSPLFVPVNDAWRHGPHVRACAYEKEDDEE